MRKRLFAFTCAFSIVISLMNVSGVSASNKDSSTDWLKTAVYGINASFDDFNVADWRNDQVKASEFAKNVAENLKEVGAGYFMYNISATPGKFNAPSRRYAEITGYAAGTKTPDPDSGIDMPMLLANELSKFNIKLILQIPSNPPESDTKARTAFGWPSAISASPTVESVKLWGDVIKEWGIRYGDKVAGFWIGEGTTADVYNQTITYNKNGSDVTEKAIEYLKQMMKEGNPNRIFALNNGPVEPGRLTRETLPQEDFTAGMANEFKEIPTSRWVGSGLQWHQLGYIGKAWDLTTLDYPSQYLLDYIYNYKLAGAVITLNVSFKSNQIDAAQKAFLLKLKALIRDNTGYRHTLLNNNIPGFQIKITGQWIKKINMQKGGWGKSDFSWYRKNSPINYDAYVSESNNALFELYFKGTGISYIGEKGINYGLVDVFIDNFYRRTVDCRSLNNREAYNQYLFAEEGLTNGAHKITLVSKSMSELFIDAFAVTDYQAITQSEIEKLEIKLTGFYVKPKTPLFIVRHEDETSSDTGSQTSSEDISQAESGSESQSESTPDETTTEPELTLDLLNNLIGTTSGDIVSIRMKKAPILTIDMQNALMNANKGFKFQFVDEKGEMKYTWKFNKMVNISGDVDLSLNPAISSNQDISQFVNTKVYQIISFKHNGKLPDSANIVVRNNNKFKKGNFILLKYYNPVSKIFEDDKSSVQMTADAKYLSFNISHCSSYVLALNTATSTNDFPSWMIVVAVIVTVLLAGGAFSAYYIFKIKKRSESK